MKTDWLISFGISLLRYCQGISFHHTPLYLIDAGSILLNTILFLRVTLTWRITRGAIECHFSDELFPFPR